jgi:NADH dehydrogenase FAD-containing subunit
MVDRYQRSVSHPHLLATGDVAERQDRKVPHSGVHAVHAGPVVAANLRSILAGMQPGRSYTPRRASLYLLSTGNRSAILVFGRLAARGRWVWRLKRWIDKRWVRGYARLAGQV